MTYQPAPQPPTEPAGWPAPTPARSGWSAWSGRTRGIIVAVLIVLVGAGSLIWNRASGSALADADKACNDGRTSTTLADGGRTLIIDAAGTKQILGPVDVQTEACILKELKAPAAVVQHIDGTRALDGQQTDSWPGYSARWTYHPDSGLDITIQKK